MARAGAKPWATPHAALLVPLIFVILLGRVVLALLPSSAHPRCCPSLSTSRWTRTQCRSKLLPFRECPRDICTYVPQRSFIRASDPFPVRLGRLSRLQAARRTGSALEGPETSPSLALALSRLREPVDAVEGIGPRRREELERRLGLYSLADALVNLPQRISDK
jgi:hypothetical protein